MHRWGSLAKAWFGKKPAEPASGKPAHGYRSKSKD
jgi:hypothetical protein